MHKDSLGRVGGKKKWKGRKLEGKIAREDGRTEGIWRNVRGRNVGRRNRALVKKKYYRD